MTYGDMMALTRPWKGPFRIVTTKNEIFDVRHPEGFLLTTTYINVGLLKHPDSNEYDRSTLIDLAQIVRVEPLAIPASTKCNGQTG